MSQLKDYSPRIGPGYSSIPAGASALTQIIETRNVVVPVTAAQIQAMSVTPVSIAPAPGTGRAIIVDSIVVELILTSTAFASGGVVHFYYHGLTVELMAQTIAAATVNGSAGTSLIALEPVQTSGGSVVTKELGVDLTNATGAFTSGTGTAKVFMRYRIITL